MQPISRKAAALATVGLMLLIVLVELGIAKVSFRLFVHLLPLTPLLTRGALLFIFRGIRWDQLSEAAKLRQEYRTVALGLMAISFTALVALTIVNAQIATMLFLPVYYMLLGFLGFLVVLNIQSYKEYEWVNALGDAFLDLGTLSMLLSIVSIFLSSSQKPYYKYLFASLALGAWVIDHLVRLYIEWNIFHGKIKRKAEEAKAAQTCHLNTQGDEHEISR